MNVDKVKSSGGGEEGGGGENVCRNMANINNNA